MVVFFAEMGRHFRDGYSHTCKGVFEYIDTHGNRLAIWLGTDYSSAVNPHQGVTAT